MKNIWNKIKFTLGLQKPYFASKIESKEYHNKIPIVNVDDRDKDYTVFIYENEKMTINNAVLIERGERLIFDIVYEKWKLNDFRIKHLYKTFNSKQFEEYYDIYNF